jgi:hypothetical protein
MTATTAMAQSRSRAGEFTAATRARRPRPLQRALLSTGARGGGDATPRLVARCAPSVRISFRAEPRVPGAPSGGAGARAPARASAAGAPALREKVPYRASSAGTKALPATSGDPAPAGCRICAPRAKGPLSVRTAWSGRPGEAPQPRLVRRKETDLSTGEERSTPPPRGLGLTPVAAIGCSLSVDPVYAAARDAQARLRLMRKRLSPLQAVVGISASPTAVACSRHCRLRQGDVGAARMACLRRSTSVP